MTWKPSPEEQQKLRHQKIALAIALFTLLAGVFSWYYLVYARTPEYALQALQSAIKEKNSENFFRYADMDALSAQIYDDLTVDLFAYDSTLTPETKELFSRFYVLIKPEYTAGMCETFRKSIAAGQWTLPEGGSLLKGRQLGIDYERFLERSQLRNICLLKIDTITQNGNSATAQLHISDQYTQMEFTLEVGLKQCPDGHWQLESLKNYREYLQAIAPLHNRDIASYIKATQPIIDKYNIRLQKDQQTFQGLAITRDGSLSSDQQKALQAFLEKEVLPALDARQKELDAVSLPAGARYLSQLRKDSTKATQASWQHFLTGILKQQQGELEQAESFHKEALEKDQRISEILHHTALSRNVPNIP